METTNEIHQLVEKFISDGEVKDMVNAFDDAVIQYIGSDQFVSMNDQLDRENKIYDLTRIRKLLDLINQAEIKESCLRKMATV